MGLGLSSRIALRSISAAFRWLIDSLVNLSSTFTSTDTSITDRSGQDLYANIESGRYSVIDGATEYIVIGDITGYTADTEIDTINVRIRTATAGVTVWVQSDDANGYSDTTTKAGLWETVSIVLSAPVSQCDNVLIGHSVNDAAYTAGSIAWVEIIDSVGGTVCKNYNAVSSDATANGLNNVIYPDASGNGFHGYFVGGEGATGVGSYPYVGGKNARFWFSKTTTVTFTDTFTDTDSKITFKIVCNDTNTNSRFILFSSSTQTGSHWLFAAQNGDAGALTNNSGTTTVTVDGNTVATRDAAWDAINDGFEHTVVITGIDFSAWTGALSINTYQVLDFEFIGSVTELQIDIGTTGTNDHTYQPDGLTSGDWADLTGSNDGTVANAEITLGERKATPPQLAGLDYNEYQRFNGNIANYVTATAAVTSYPYTLECKIITKMTSVGAFLSISDASTSNNTAFLGTTAGGYAQLTIEDSGGSTTITGATTLINDGLPHTVKGVFTSATDRELFVDDVSQGTSAVSRTPTGLDTFGVGCKFDLTPSDPFAGIVYDAVLNNGTSDQQKLLGYGLTPWADTIGSNDGSVTGTLLDNLVLEDEASAGNDSLGNAISLPRVNDNVANLVGDGDKISVKANTVLDTTKTVSAWIYHDGTARTFIDLGTPTVGSTTTDLTSSGFTGVSYFVNGASGTTLLSGWNHIAVVSTAALATDNVDQLQISSDLTLAAEEWGAAEALAQYNKYRYYYGL